MNSDAAGDAAGDPILLENTDGVLAVTLNRPHRKNAITVPMWAELAEVFSGARGNPDVRAVLITGAGGDFCSGADLAADTRSERPPVHQLTAMARVSDAALALHRLDCPTLAAVDGVAVGAGMNLALHCDLVVCSERARFSEIFARRGLTIDFGGSWILPRLVGVQKAKELALLADIIEAGTAREMGLVNRVVPHGELMDLAWSWARRLAAAPPIAIQMTKRLLTNSLSSTLDEALENEGMAQTVNFGTRDTAEAIVAWQEGREPRFEGR